ncbi:10511_t:CDS:1 [Funneliformis geosporum]|uniref:19239_t:CDS:1 n=1 Tax=Funneliformis geosporum TaxID=1117311 RepID=A0A9W4SRE3_9GLOM|nr:19239_t:CDS:1 [Funneliformis geosporum]CAI2184435.1 10511_t:CDS:1 [Funneliformis geosporum]
MESNSQSLNDRSRPKIIVPSPRMSNLNPEDFMPRKSRGCKPSNAFIIYRKIYVKTLLAEELHYKMTEASRWASESWSIEREELKDEYREFAKKVSKIYRKKAQDLDSSRVLPTILPSQPIRSPNTTSNTIIENDSPQYTNDSPQYTNQTLTYNTETQQQSFDAYYQEQQSSLPLSLFYETPIVRHDIYFTFPFTQCEVCNFPFECICLGVGGNDDNRTQDVPAYNWQGIYDGNIDMNMEDF